jgi:hypothetical protein
MHTVHKRLHGKRRFSEKENRRRAVMGKQKIEQRNHKNDAQGEQQ